MKGYLEISVGDDGGTSYIRESRLEDLKDVSGIVFDCDGVLIDIAESYGMAVAETASYIVEAFTGVKLPGNLIDQDVIFAFKRTGGFNNDWDLTYALVMYILSKVPEDRLEELNEVAGAARRYEDPFERFTFMKNNIQGGTSIPLYGLGQALKKYAESLDETGVIAVSGNLLESVGVNVNEVLGYSGEVRRSMIPILFEQLFCGPALFEETFNMKPKFKTSGNGLIENGRPIITFGTLEMLTSFLDGPKFGIASGSMKNPARRVLGRLLDDLDPDVQIWMEDIDRAASVKDRGGLQKPNPYSLRAASRLLEPFSWVLYVGDTMADLVMARRANEEDSRFLFAGVYQNSIHPEAIMADFITEGADIITPSVNDLPHILEFIRGELA